MITTKYDVDGKDIYVYDDVFSYSEIDTFYNKAIQKPFYRLNVDNKNIKLNFIDYKWYCEFGERESNEFGALQIYKKRIDFLKNLENIHRQYINCNTFETVDNIHIDGENTFTLLHFINFEWNMNWFGETIFLNQRCDEIMKSIIPKPGRIILFDGTIPHSARSPSKNSLYPRYTLITKFFIE